MKQLTGKIIYYSIASTAFLGFCLLGALFLSPSPEGAGHPRIPLLIMMVVCTAIAAFFRWLAKRCDIKPSAPVVLNDKQRVDNWLVIGILLLLFGFVSAGATHVAGFLLGIYVLVISKRMAVALPL